MTSKAPDSRPPDRSGGVEYIQVDEQRAGQRLDNFLSGHLKGVPRSLVYRILRTGQVRVNKGRAKPNYKLQAGDRVRIPPLERGGGGQGAPAGQLAAAARRLMAGVLYENRDFLVLNKPAGMAVHGGSGLQYGLIEALKSLGGDYAALELVHRLDRGTSGCLLLAKHRRALLGLHALLRERRMDKHYTALLAGRLEAPLEIDAALVRARRGGERRVDIGVDGKEARSRIVPQRLYRSATLAQVRIDTGRTHQIRVHCAGAGHPLAGDERYGDAAFNQMLRETGLRRIFLHASELRFTWERPYVLTAPLPDELNGVLEQLDE
jgi:23S rRNA pseudouridine955/2504/2580 synthase